MKRMLLAIGLVLGLGLGGGAWVSAQTPPAPSTPKATPPAHAHGGPGAGGMDCPMGMMGGGKGMGMMGGGMGMGMMGGGMGMMGGADTKVSVKNVDKGVTITFTATDPARVTRLQKIAEAMRLMHEANTP